MEKCCLGSNLSYSTVCCR